MSNQPLGETLETISEMTDLMFVYNDELVLDKFITYSAKNTTPLKILKDICKQVEISHKTFGNNTIVLFKNSQPPKISSNEKTIRISSTPVVSNLQLLSNVRPKYPDLAISENIQGSVTIKMLVSLEGKVEKVEIDKSSGSKILDNYTIDFAKKLIYKPFKINNKPSASWTYITYTYILTRN